MQMRLRAASLVFLALTSFAGHAAFADLAGDRSALQKEYDALLKEPQTRAVDFPDGRSLRPGEHGKEVPLLRIALANYGFVPVTAVDEDPLLYDEALSDSTKKFQGEVGLKDDGVIGTWTRRALRGMDGNRLLRLQQTLAQTDPPSSGRYILVNIAAGMVYAINDGKVELESKAIVGKLGTDTRTPVFSSEIHSVTINPIWTAPKSIVEKEFGGNAHVEKPGPSNPLGKVRIDIPNRYAVFLHSTNHPQLFGRDVRSFSHGCVRVEKITDLAHWLTGNDLWAGAGIDEQLTSWKTKRVELDDPIPIYLQYRTASVATTGTVIYHADPYHEAAPPESVKPVPDEVPPDLTPVAQTVEGGPNRVAETPALDTTSGSSPASSAVHSTSAVIPADADGHTIH